MNADFSADDLAFQSEVRSFLESEFPAEYRIKIDENKRLSKDELVDWQKILYRKGWAAPSWPKEYGGRGSTPIERVIWGQEVSKYKVPGGFFEIGQGMAGPVLMMYATEEQKKRFLPPLAKGEEVWCQLFSEPGAGSDLAGLKTKSVLEGDTWTINGQKIWTSGAHYSDFGILVTRSDPDAHKHKGLTYFFLDMKSPGVEVRPIKQISGGANFNEVYFTDVKIPDDQRLGAVGDGWKVALTTLMNERLAVGDASGPDFEEIFNLACKQDLNGDLAIKNGSVRDKLADWYCQYSGLKYTKYRNISALSRGETPGPEASITKVVSGNKLQEIANFGMDLMDSAGVIRDETTDNEQSMYQYGFFGAAGIRIAGGTDEILKNIISEQVLGLPQDMRADKGIPFNKIPTSNK